MGTLAALAVVASAAQAAVFTVNQATDVVDPTPIDGVCDVNSMMSGDQCTVRAAFQTANGNGGATTDEIVLTLDVALTIVGTDENNALNGDLDFRGDNGGDLTVRSNVPGTLRQIDQNALERVVQGSGGNLTLRDVELTGGNITGGALAQGGGISFIGSVGQTLRLDHARVTNNTATSTGGANLGGGVYVLGQGPVQIVNGSVIQNNIAGGTANNVQGQGGGIALETGAGAVTVADSTITGNRAGVGPTFTNMVGLGGGIYFEPAGTAVAPLTITNSDVNGNRAGGLGGSGLPSQGGGLFVDTGFMDSTVPDVEITGGSFDGNFAGGGPGANGAPGGGDDPQGHGGGIRIASPNATVDVGGASVTGNRAGGRDGVSDGTGLGVGAGISASGTSLTIEDSPLNDNLAGVASAGNVSGSGGGISADGAGTLTLDGATVDGNLAGTNMAGSLGAGGITALNTGRMQILDSVVTDNATRTSGGGIVRFRVAIGGQADVISDTRVSDNSSASAAGGLYIESDSDTMVSRSEFARNIAGFGNGGGIQATAETAPGGTPELTIENSTIDANDASGLDNSSRGGGLAIGFGGPDFVMDLTLRQSTVTGNKVGTSGTSQGGNLAVEGDVSDAASVDISGTIISGGTGGMTNPDCRFDFLQRSEVVYSSDGGNVQGPSSQGGTDCEFTNVAQGDLQNTNPMLGAIASNGGLTETRALLAGSPAIDRVPPALCAGLTTDQRGYPRPSVGGANCDSGAYELFLCSGSPLNPPGPFTGCTPPAVVTPTPTPTTTTTPQPTPAKKCKKGQKLKKGKCVKKKRKKK